MAYDGSLKFDTKVDTTGFDKGISMLKKAAGALGLAKLGNEIIDVGSTFEASMSQVAAISMATGGELEALTAAAKEMGAATKYTAAEAADGLQYLSLAGYSAAESIEALPKVLRLAQAGGMDLAYASDLLTDSMAVMGLGIQDMDNFSDQLAMAASKSNTSVAQLGEAVLVAGGQAKLAAMSTEDMNTALGILADNGIKGSEGGTALRNTLKNLYTPTSASAKVMKKLGISTSDAEGSLRGAQDVLKDLKTALDGMSEADRMTAMGDIFDTRTIAAANALLENCGDRWDELEGYLSTCDGAARRMADTMNDNLAGKTKIMQSAAEALGITIYEKAEPALSAMVTGATNALGALDGFAQSDAASVIGSLAVPLAAAAGGYGMYTIAVNGAKTAQMLFNAASMANPIGLAVAGIAAAAGGFAMLDNAVNGAARAIKKEREEYEERNEAALADAETKAGQIERAQTLSRELDNLVDKNGRVKAGYEDRVKYICSELSEATGTEINQVDGVIIKYGELKKSIDDTLKSKKVAALMEGVSGNYSEAVQNAEECRKNLIDLEQQSDNLSSKLDAEIARGYKLAGITAIKLYSVNKELAETEESYYKYASDVAHYNELIAAAENKNYDEFLELYRSRGRVINDGTDAATGAAALRLQSLEAEKKKIEELKQKAEEDCNFKLAEQFGQQLQTIDGQIEEAKTIVDTGMQAIADTAEGQAQKIGENISAGIAVGVQQGAWRVNTTSAALMQSALLSAQNTGIIESPSKLFRDKVGKFIPAGVAVGISQNSDMVDKAARGVIDGAMDSAKAAAGIHSPARDFRDEVGKMISLGLAYGIEDGADYALAAMEDMSKGLIEEGKTAAETQENLHNRVLSSLKNTFDLGIITEEQYYTELEKLRDEYFTAGSKDWEKYTLEIINWQKKQDEEQIRLAKEQRENLKKINDGIAADIQSSFNEVKDARKSFSDTLLGMEDGFSTVTYKGLGENGEDIVDTILDTGSLKKANDTKEAFEEAALAAKDRIAASLGEENKELTRQIYETIRSMGAEEGLAFSNAILNANGGAFADWLAEQARGAELNEKVSLSIYAEDMQETGERLAEELYTAWDEKLAEQFGALPEDFWEFGTDAAAGFYDGFMSDIDGYISAMERRIGTIISGYSSGGIGGGTNISGSYNTTEYNITASGGSEGSWIRAIRDRETIERMTGGY